MDNTSELKKLNDNYIKTESDQELVHFLEEGTSDIFSQAKAQWFLGDWHNLARLEEKIIVMHPERNRLALLVASALLQLGNQEKAMILVKLALNWGCSPKIVAQVLIAGVYNTLGRIAVLRQDEERIKKHFKAAVDINGNNNTNLVTHARAVREMTTLGLLSQATCLVNEEIENISSLKRHYERTMTLNLIQKEQQTIREALHHMQMSHSDSSDKLNFENLNIGTINKFVDECFNADDLYEKIDELLNTELQGNLDKFNFYCTLTRRFFSAGDKIMVMHYLNATQDNISEDPVIAKHQYSLLAKYCLEYGLKDMSIDFSMKAFSLDSNLSSSEANLLIKTYNELNHDRKKKQEHGHDLLLSYLYQHCSAPNINQDKKRVLVEIGSTREEVPGQGSTYKLANFCNTANVHFITVDMDPHNTKAAADLMKKINPSFQAINMKGEDFLKEYDGIIDFIFLDAYDFDHGGHSELRQRRYERFLGGRIDEQQCHKMHLECAQSLISKLQKGGIVCVDDTWQDTQGNWTAKGTLAVPFLLQNNFEIIEARNRALLMKHP
ncbi:hypothetical protein [Legionella longbeachae]|uniref:Methyltransferase domain-containing protein n=1 Tax=Legionella longbeachae serogroup 1 (strain NSW150) TaxID=661367 RepID=D3HMC3_LEGLN|nr:hypothetical protein [Legionella longbeachae]VEE04034.1 Uncharacterised protein [Legionella oakridgensis]HBD7396895.1 hypothetical protein [Legionella pneumophila]ARB93114.1 hypothetical protein A6J40_13435 [Legionella longbeachae]ARM33824.1 hypothetical protein B0B39_09915 [Legionella longbeachae]EEZ97000.1 conserved hypothetical protein [Legionella longbeachae D-4968]